MTQLSFNIYVKPAESHPQMFCAIALPVTVQGEPKQTAAEAIEDVKSKLQAQILKVTQEAIDQKKGEWMEIHSFPMQIDFNAPNVSETMSVEDIERRLEVLNYSTRDGHHISPALTPCEASYIVGLRSNVNKEDYMKNVTSEILKYSKMLLLHIKK